MDLPGRFIHGKQMEVPPSSPSPYQVAMDAIESCVLDLFDQAVRVQDVYLAHVDAVEAKAKGWESRSTLQLSCTRKGNHLDLKWTGVKWYGPTNARVSVRVPIKKGSDGFSYSADKLKVFAKEWELEAVMEAEKQLQSIRRRGKHLVNAAASIRNVLRFNKLDSGNSEDLHQDGED